MATQNPFESPGVQIEPSLDLGSLQQKLRSDRLSFTEYVVLSAWAVKGQIATFIALLGIFYLPQETCSLFMKRSFEHQNFLPGFVYMGGYMIALLLSHTAIVAAGGASLDGRPASLGAVIGTSFSRFFSVVVASFVTSLFCFGWMLLLVLPAIWALVRYAFITQAIALHGEDPLQALATSRELVRGAWWETFAVYVIQVLFGAVGEFGVNQLALRTGMPEVGVILCKTALASIQVFGAVVLTAMYLNRRYTRAGVAPSPSPG